MVSTGEPGTRAAYATHLQRFTQFGGVSPWWETRAMAEKVLPSMTWHPKDSKQEPFGVAFRRYRQWLCWGGYQSCNGLGCGGWTKHPLKRLTADPMEDLRFCNSWGRRV